MSESCCGSNSGRMSLTRITYGAPLLSWPHMLLKLFLCTALVLSWLSGAGVRAASSSYSIEPSTSLVQILHVRGCGIDSRPPHATMQCFAGDEDGTGNTTVRLTLRGLHFPPLTTPTSSSPSLRVCLQPSVSLPLEPVADETTMPSQHPTSDAVRVDCPVECVNVSACPMFPTQLLSCTLPHPRHTLSADVSWMDVTLLHRVARERKEAEGNAHVGVVYAAIAALRHAVRIAPARSSSSQSHSSPSASLPHSAVRGISLLERLDSGEAGAAEVSSVLGVGGMRGALRTLYRRVFVPRLSALHSVTRQIAMPPVRGVILHGPPGVGKTLMAHRLAKLLQDGVGGTRLTVLSAADMVGKYAGESEQSVRDAVLGRGRYAVHPSSRREPYAADATINHTINIHRNNHTRHRSGAGSPVDGTKAVHDHDMPFLATAGGGGNVLQRPLRVVVMDGLDALCRRRGGAGDREGGSEERATKAAYDGVTNTLISLMDGLHRDASVRTWRVGRTQDTNYSEYEAGRGGAAHGMGERDRDESAEARDETYDDDDDEAEEEGEEDVLIIGLTHRLHAVDRALLRPGRFEVVIDIPMPDVSAREEIWSVHMAALRAAGALGDDVNLATLAQGSEGFTGADIAGAVRSATSYALRRCSATAYTAPTRDTTENGTSPTSPLLTVRAWDVMRAMAEMRGGHRAILPPVVRKDVPLRSGDMHEHVYTRRVTGDSDKDETSRKSYNDANMPAKGSDAHLAQLLWVDHDGTLHDSLARVHHTLQRVWASAHITGFSLALIGPAGTGKTALTNRISHMARFGVVRYIDCRALVATSDMHALTSPVPSARSRMPLMQVIESALTAAAAVSRGLVVLDDVDVLLESLGDFTAQAALWYRLERFVHEPDPMPRPERSAEAHAESEMHEHGTNRRDDGLRAARKGASASHEENRHAHEAPDVVNEEHSSNNHKDNHIDSVGRNSIDAEESGARSNASYTHRRHSMEAVHAEEQRAALWWSVPPRRALILTARESTSLLSGPYRHDTVVRTHRLTRSGVRRLLQHHRVAADRLDRVNESVRDDGVAQKALQQQHPQALARQASQSYPFSMSLYDYYRITDAALRATTVPRVRPPSHSQGGDDSRSAFIEQDHHASNVPIDEPSRTETRKDAKRAGLTFPAAFADVSDQFGDHDMRGGAPSRAAAAAAALQAEQVAANFYTINSSVLLRRFGAAVRGVVAEMGLLDPYTGWRDAEASANDDEAAEYRDGNEGEEDEGDGADEDALNEVAGDYAAYTDAAAAVEVLW